MEQSPSENEIVYRFTYKDVDGTMKAKDIPIHKNDCELAIAKFEKENPDINWRGFRRLNKQ